MRQATAASDEYTPRRRSNGIAYPWSALLRALRPPPSASVRTLSSAGLPKPYLARKVGCWQRSIGRSVPGTATLIGYDSRWKDWGLNVTPLAAIHQKHKFVFDRDTSDWLTVDQVIGAADYATVVRDIRIDERLKALDDKPRYVCPLCGDAMFLAKARVHEKDPHRFYFRHVRNESACVGTQTLSERQLNAMRFNGAKEGLLHIRFKERVVESLQADPRFDTTLLEARWESVDRMRWRKPDVQTNYGGQHIAFEVQLSTTYLHVICERMKFYRDNNGALLWLFRDLDFEAYRQAEDDILYSNNSNAFRVTDQTVTLSKAKKRFALECSWIHSEATATGVTERQLSAVVFFDELKFDMGKNGAPRAYYFDCEGERLGAERSVPAVRLRSRFETFWLAGPKMDDEWQSLRSTMAAFGVELPMWPRTDGFEQLLNTLYSVKHGRMVGFRYSNMPFPELTHYLADKRKGFLRVFHWALAAFDRIQLVKEQDRTQNLEEKVGRYRSKLKGHDQAFALDPNLRSVVRFLFPEIRPDMVR